MFFVRTASERDLAKVRALLSEVFHATYDPLYGAAKTQELLDAWHSMAQLKARVDERGAEFLVADDGRRIGGMAYAHRMPDRPKTVRLRQLYVHPDLQRGGIGRDIFAELETCFPDANLLQLEVDPRNAPAIAFYRAHGLVDAGEFVEAAGVAAGLPALVMEKTLAG